MAIVKFDPFRGFESMTRRFNDFLKDFDDSSYFMNNQTRSFWPMVDIKEEEKNIFVTAEIPGMSKDDIKITVNDENILTIKGEKKREETEKEESFVKLERCYGSFARSFMLPEVIKKDKIKANYKDGVLSIELEKVEPKKPKEIEINVN